MKGDLIRRVRCRKHDVRLRLPFDDIMEFAMALLSISPRAPRALGWTLLNESDC
jgi:hypothetical protein